MEKFRIPKKICHNFLDIFLIGKKKTGFLQFMLKNLEF